MSEVTSLRAEVEKWKAIAVTACKDDEESAEEIKRLRNWMDNNFTHCEPGAVPVLGSVSKRIWYHATDDTESYPFSEVACKAVDNE